MNRDYINGIIINKIINSNKLLARTEKICLSQLSKMRIRWKILIITFDKINNNNCNFNSMKIKR